MMQQKDIMGSSSAGVHERGDGTLQTVVLAAAQAAVPRKNTAHILDGMPRIIIQNSREERAQQQPYAVQQPSSPTSAVQHHQQAAHLRNLEHSLALLHGAAAHNPTVFQVPWATSTLVPAASTTTTAAASAPTGIVGAPVVPSSSPFSSGSFNNNLASRQQQQLGPEALSGFGRSRMPQPSLPSSFAQSTGLIATSPLDPRYLHHPQQLHPRPWSDYDVGQDVSWTISTGVNGAIPFAMTAPHMGLEIGQGIVHSHQNQEQHVAAQQLTRRRVSLPVRNEQQETAAPAENTRDSSKSVVSSRAIKRNRSKESSDEDETPKTLRLDRRLDGEARLVIEFESYGTRGRVLQTFGRERWVLPDGLRGSHNAYDQEWRFEIVHGDLVEGSMPPVVCVIWRITHVQSDHVTERTEKQDEAEKRLSLGWTIATKVFVQAMANRVENLREQLKNEHDLHRTRKLHEAIGILQPKGFTQGPLMFGLRHRSVQEAMQQAQ